MVDDYRNTKYCPNLDDVASKKQEVVNLIKKDFPNAVDMHNYLRKNEGEYKVPFMKAYNCKCAYCGVSIDLIKKDAFEIDHYICQNDPRFSTKKEAGYIENLILACHDCNHKKRSFVIPAREEKKLHPDASEIRRTFWRDDLYYIKISESEKTNSTIVEFYKQLKLGTEVHRLDFLLMNMIGLQRKYSEKGELCLELGKIVDMLRIKRNMM